jgi:DUF971 family protein
MILRADDIQVIGNQLAIRWSDGQESFFELEQLRRNCPCAVCTGEPDLTGRVHQVASPAALTAKSFELVSIERIGGYALQPRWADGHITGLYSFEYLRQLDKNSAA